ncbi:hypothetical protein KC361_g290 [Hortaea werneckii]|nr:hypothetical protein KC361_g290 [Hortaea werneckii]
MAQRYYLTPIVVRANRKNGWVSVERVLPTHFRASRRLACIALQARWKITFVRTQYDMMAWKEYTGALRTPSSSSHAFPPMLCAFIAHLNREDSRYMRQNYSN